MFKSEQKCKGEGCNSYFIQNKKYHLCNTCVFKKNHAGKSQQEIYSERSEISREQLTNFFKQSKSINYQKPSFKTKKTDEELMFERNRRNQDSITENDIEGFIDEGERKFAKKIYKQKKQKPVKQITAEQALINRAYRITCADMDYVEEKICSGCLKYQGGDIKLSHSHLISRKHCKEIGRIDLISERKNLTYHCLDFGENTGCHRKWENPKQRHELKDYKNNIKIIEELAPQLLSKYKSKDFED
jgi:hypothetical protein